MSNNVVLVTPAALSKLGLSHAAMVLDLHGRVRCHGLRSEGAVVVSVK